MVYNNLTIGVVAMQGSYAKHIKSLDSIGVKSRYVRTPDDLRGIDALILPGGESTTMTLLIQSEGLWEPLNKVLDTLPTFGTCAGAIMLGQQFNDNRVHCFEKIDYHTERNAYGRQVESFSTELVMPNIINRGFHAIFIRAPKFKYLGANVEILGVNGSDPVLIREGNILSAAFHPELTDDPVIHKYFIDEIVLKSRNRR